MVRIGSIGSKLKGGDVEGDWVTIGVLVGKLPPKDSAKGDKLRMGHMTTSRPCIHMTNESKHLESYIINAQLHRWN